MAQGAVHEKLWTPANVVTLLRICLVPVFVVAIISPWPEYFPFWADAEASKPWIAAGIFSLWPPPTASTGTWRAAAAR